MSKAETIRPESISVCRECGASNPSVLWEESTRYCETCGDNHPVLICPSCGDEPNQEFYADEGPDPA